HRFGTSATGGRRWESSRCSPGSLYMRGCAPRIQAGSQRTRQRRRPSVRRLFVTRSQMCAQVLAKKFALGLSPKLRKDDDDSSLGVSFKVDARALPGPGRVLGPVIGVLANTPIAVEKC